MRFLQCRGIQCYSQQAASSFPCNYNFRKIVPVKKSHVDKRLIVYLRNTPKKHDNTKFFLCNMWRPDTELEHTFLANSTIIIDKYHSIKQIT